MKLFRSFGKGVLECAALLLAITAIQSCSACATVGVQRKAFTALDTGLTVMRGTQRVENGLVCGRPSAPPAPACVTIAQHHELQGYLLQASTLGTEAQALVRGLPENSDPPWEALDKVAKLFALLQRVLSALPRSQQVDALQAQLVGG